MISKNGVNELTGSARVPFVGAGPDNNQALDIFVCN